VGRRNTSLLLRGESRDALPRQKLRAKPKEEMDRRKVVTDAPPRDGMDLEEKSMRNGDVNQTCTRCLTEVH
jgi:hypothetical protein